MINTNKYIAYGLLYIILFPVALILGLGIVLTLIQAVANPVLLFPLFILSAFVVYTIASFIFYIKTVRHQRTCKPLLRDLIRINAFIVILPAALFIWQGVSIASNPNMINEAINQVRTVQPTLLPISDVILAKLIKGIYYFLVGYAIVIIIHITYTFRLLKQHNSLFVA